MLESRSGAHVLTFDEDAHAYLLDGRPVPGTTRVLTAAGFIDGQWFNERARDRGTAVHLATQFADEGCLDPSSVAEEIVPYVKAWERFKLETGFTLTEPPELLVGSPSLGFATMIDRVGTMNGEKWCLNLKTGSQQPWHHVQTAGEALAYAEWTGASAKAAIALKRGCVHLCADGKYNLEPHERRIDFARFRAAVVIYQTKEEWE